MSAALQASLRGPVDDRDDRLEQCTAMTGLTGSRRQRGAAVLRLVLRIPTMTEVAIRVVLVEDDALLREGLAQLAEVAAAGFAGYVHKAALRPNCCAASG
jgi:hypothetical protein